MIREDSSSLRTPVRARAEAQAIGPLIAGFHKRQGLVQRESLLVKFSSETAAPNFHDTLLVLIWSIFSHNSIEIPYGLAWISPGS